ncbi:hypothetical protein ACKI1I_16720 [Streptomyces turgidiscabies]|uniref:Lipoprotein n=1 Tax=Streptomyces turgidiscabies (strain Car8) TaxID=698760 RepID=L7ESF0_STRT8|nr:MULTISPECIES: hypothetical protein [Streptomyces]ELP61601.1 hypothetical protein STRTUCAR8_08463 [Streptomyces turgidiscabies Car8]MDX3495029.1 hypothetical protein [Streptomyces turgidiscabies]GAQ70900.1 hypothetical protein T45_02642 [Streptomyces turgidiscabies]
MNRHLRKAVFATAAITAGLLMTACQSGTGDSSSDKSAADKPSASQTSTSVGSDPSATPGSGSGSDSSPGSGTDATPAPVSDTDSSPAQNSDSDSDTRDTAVEGINKGEGVSGTWFGNVTYVAPGKYAVTGMKDTEQQFFVSEDTKIIGYDDICDAVNTGPGGEGGVECTEAQLEKAAKKGVQAKVVISNGIATSITDDN